MTPLTGQTLKIGHFAQPTAMATGQIFIFKLSLVGDALDNTPVIVGAYRNLGSAGELVLFGHSPLILNPSPFTLNS